MRALCLLRDNIAYRKDAFNAGLVAAGFDLVNTLNKPKRGDVVVVWNRYGYWDDQAKFFEAHGAQAWVAENGHLGKGWRGKQWYALAAGHHAGAGKFPYGGPERWDSWKVQLAPWQEGGKGYLIFEQRGIGVAPNKSPPRWAETVQRKVPHSRIRTHPRDRVPAVTLEEDLVGVRACITWNSAAANLALLHGVPVYYDNPVWIGAAAGSPLSDLLAGAPPKCSDAARLDMFRHMAWAMWELEEIATGAPFKHLLQL